MWKNLFFFSSKEVKYSYFLIAVKIIIVVDILRPQTGLYIMDSMASSPPPYTESALVEEAEGRSGKLCSFLRLWQGAGTGRHKTSYSAVPSTHALALPACDPGFIEPGLLEPGPVRSPIHTQAGPCQ